MLGTTNNGMPVAQWRHGNRKTGIVSDCTSGKAGGQKLKSAPALMWINGSSYNFEPPSRP